MFLLVVWDALSQTVVREGRHGSRDAKVVEHVKRGKGKSGIGGRASFSPHTSSREYATQQKNFVVVVIFQINQFAAPHGAS
jgi:hypothetical protein